MNSNEWELARAAYDGYNNTRRVPAFDELDERDQARWLAAAKAVMDRGAFILGVSA